MAQMNEMDKRNFTNSTQNGGKTAKMQNNSAKSGMVGMSEGVQKIRLSSSALWLTNQMVQQQQHLQLNNNDRKILTSKQQKHTDRQTDIRADGPTVRVTYSSTIYSISQCMGSHLPPPPLCCIINERV